MGRNPHRGPGTESLVRDQGAKPPEAESFLKIGHPNEGANWWSDCHECHLESFLVWYTIEDSFITGVDVAKSGGLRSLKALEFEMWVGSSLAALQKSTPMPRKYIIYRNAVTGGPSHGHRQHYMHTKIGEARPCGFRIMQTGRQCLTDKHTNKQIYTHTYSS